ncbi:MAG: hypothetical protein HKM24_02385 [Gammaproteobacteria bacterium]|nr:hypothetical protein [Gammaproteobacteria bacterium]
MSSKGNQRAALNDDIYDAGSAERKATAVWKKKKKSAEPKKASTEEKTHLIKHQQTQKNRLTREREALAGQLKCSEKTIAQINSQLQGLQQKVDDIESRRESGVKALNERKKAFSEIEKKRDLQKAEVAANEKEVALISSQIKELLQQMSELESQRIFDLSTQSKRKKQFDDKQKELQKLERKEDAVKPTDVSDLIVSEHAIVRFLQRVENIDLEEIKKRILTQQVLELMGQLGLNGTFPTGAGFQVVVKNGVIVTIKD